MSRPFSDVELKALENCGFKGKYGLRNKTIFFLQTRLGYRGNEIVNLRIEWLANIRVDRVSKDQYAQIHDVLKVPKSLMKGKRVSRSVPLSEEVKKVLRDYFDKWIKIYMKLIPEKGFLFPSQKKSKTDEETHISRATLNDIYKAACESLQIPTTNVGTHSCRKVFCQKAQAVFGNDLLSIQKMMGHARLSSTEHYLKSVDINLINAYHAMFNPKIKVKHEELFMINEEEEPEVNFC